jgi:serine protease
VTDTDGHGTDVAGIADANTNNGVGFASIGFNAPLLAYRIFPSDPSGGCEGDNPPAQCSSNTLDESSAINDAVAHGAKVINLSLGASPPCSSADAEYQAVEHAIASGVVVVAAAGNETQGALDCPAADPGVIAVGATGLDDSTSPAKEKVASYSNFLASSTGGGHYMVAPGGDPSGGSDNDDLHWIENIYSSTAVQPGTCTADFHATNSVVDCRILIAGTSQATPHVAGVASLILRVRPNYSPSQVAAALCNSATKIGDSKQGCGRVDAAAAVNYAKSH